jgi:hypothetical protein
MAHEDGDAVMMDPTPLYLWDAETLDERDLIPAAAADSPQARRLAVLAAEAYAAGHGTALLEWFGDVARVLLLDVPSSPGHYALTRAIHATHAVLHGSHLTDAELRLGLSRLCELDGPDDSAEVAAATLASWAYSHLAGAYLSAEQAWQAATVLLAAVADASGEDPEPTIARCAELAYARLFQAAPNART